MRVALPRPRSGVARPALLLAVVALACAAFTPAVLRLAASDGAGTPAAEASLRSGFYDAHQFARALAGAQALPPSPMPGARAVIVPHHWLAGHLILATLRDLAAGGTVRRVILVGPNHTGAGNAGVATAALPWQTPFGLLQADAVAVQGLAAAGLASVDTDAIEHEHSIAGLMPALAYYLPHTTVVPLAVRSGMTDADVRRLAEGTTPLLDSHTVIVASVDFSHYLTAIEAHSRDRETLEALQSLDSARVLSWGNEHVDSPAALALVLYAMRQAGPTEFHLRENTDSSRSGGVLAPTVTSYINGWYGGRVPDRPPAAP